MGVALQDVHSIAVGDVIEADPVGCKDLITHFDAMLLRDPARVQPGETKTGDRACAFERTFYHSVPRRPLGSYFET